MFASNRATLNADFNRILKDLQGGLGGPVNNSNHGIVHDLHNLFAISIANLYVAGAAIAAYAVLEGTEAVGLWLGRRWDEYLTFVATAIFVPYEIYELPALGWQAPVEFETTSLQRAPAPQLRVQQLGHDHPDHFPVIELARRETTSGLSSARRPGH